MNPEKKKYINKLHVDRADFLFTDDCWKTKRFNEKVCNTIRFNSTKEQSNCFPWIARILSSIGNSIIIV